MIDVPVCKSAAYGSFSMMSSKREGDPHVTFQLVLTLPDLIFYHKIRLESSNESKLCRGAQEQDQLHYAVGVGEVVLKMGAALEDTMDQVIEHSKKQ